MVSLFAFSAIALALLLTVKMYETARMRRSFLLRTASRLDPVVGVCLSSVQKAYGTYAKEASSFLANIPQRSREMIGEFSRNARVQYLGFLPNIRGVRRLREDRQASPFLEDIRSEQERNGKGRIEDRLED